MVVPVRSARRVVVNNGKVRQITMDYKAENATDVSVWVSYTNPSIPDRRLTLGTDYQVEGVGGPGVTATINNPDGWEGVARFAMLVYYPVNQPSDMDLGGPFGKRYEDSLDRLAYSIQTVNDKANRALKLAPTEHIESDVLVAKPIGGMYLRYSADGTMILPDTGPEGAGGPVGIPEAPSNGIYYSRRNAVWEPTPPPLSRPSEFMDPDTLRPLTVNGVPASGGGFPTTAQQEIIYAFSGGSVTGDLPNLTSSDLATCYVSPPTEDSTNWVAATTPWMNYNGGNTRIMPLDIRTIFNTTPVSIPLFKPVVVNGFGMLVWEYIGEEPINTLLTGSLSVLLRVGSIQADQQIRYIMRLCGANLPALELGQNNGRRNLATAPSGLYEPRQLRNYLEYNDNNLPPTAALITSVGATADLFVGYDVGSIAAGSTAEALTPGSAEVRTTKWMDVSSFNKLDISFLMYDVGTSSISRIQYKVAGGEIRYFTAHSITDTSQRVYRLPADAEQVRIHYSASGDAPGTPKFKPLSVANSANFDVLKGYWINHTFNVNRDVTFWPGGRYYIDFFTQIFSDQGTAREYGFRYQSGGFQFMFDAGRIRKKIAKTFFDSEA